MFPAAFCCSSSCSSAADGVSWRRRHQERKLQMLSSWRDGLERQLAAVTAAIATLERQMERDSGQPTT